MQVADAVTAQERSEIAGALRAMNLVDASEAFSVARLSGGVSCDVYRLDLATGTVCLKRALPKLRVAADWRAPVARAMSEVAWMKLAGGIVPGCVPKILGEDPDRHMFAMEFFPPETYPVWKAQLASGSIDARFAGRVGETIARIHAATAGRREIARAFANDAQFLALRLDPFLLHAARKHDDLAQRLRALADSVAGARIALMHGDVSPKNILCGPNGPIFLDAETTCYGDPAFDLAFCLTHLLLKCVWHPRWTGEYLECFAALKDAYLRIVDWERPAQIEARTAQLVPALLLARVDGKSPAEYLTTKRDKSFVRAEAKSLFARESIGLDEIAQRWSHAVNRALLQ